MLLEQIRIITINCHKVLGNTYKVASTKFENFALIKFPLAHIIGLQNSQCIYSV